MAISPHPVPPPSAAGPTEPRAAAAQRSGRSGRLLLLCTGTRVGGMERVAVSLARGLAARGWDVHTVFPDGPGIEPLRDWVAAEGVAAEFSPALVHLGRERTLRDVSALRALVKRSGCDVVNLHYGASHISLKDLLAVRLAGRRCVASVHHPSGWSEANSGARRSTSLAGRLARRVVVNSLATREQCRAAGVAASRLSLVPCGVPAPRHTWPRAEARALLGVPKDAMVIGTLARLVPEKRIDLLLEAVARLAGRTTPAPFLLVGGDGPERAALEARAALLMGDRARFLGYVPDPEPLYGAMDVFALPSDLEGFGMVYLEAALQGVPSVATAVGGVPDAIEDARTGLLVPPRDVDALEAALAELVRDEPLRRRFGEQARTRALERFTEDAMAAAYERVLLA